MQLYPAIKARMGDWQYYIVRMTMREVAREVQLASQLWEDASLSDAIQREIDQSRVKQQLVNFLSRRSDRFFSSLVVAAIGGNPTWTPLSSRFGDSFGELSFETDPRYFALDGQHRLKAIAELLSDPAGAPPGFPEEQLSVIVVVREHQGVDDRLWLQRYRRLFSSLNRYAKPTDADTNIVMDEDDVVAIFTRRIITDHEFFCTSQRQKESFRVQTKGKNLKSGAPHFTSLQTLYEVNKTLWMTTDRRRNLGRARDLKIFLQFRPDEAEIDRQYAYVSRCWDALLRALPVLREPPERMRAHDPPASDPHGCRDHLLFWPIGQQMLAEVARSLLDAGESGQDVGTEGMAAMLQPLGRVPWELNAPPWRHLLLVRSSEGEAWRIRSEERKPAVEVASRIVRWIVGLDPLRDREVQELRADWGGLLYPEPPQQAAIEGMWQVVVDCRARLLTDGAVP